MKIKLNMEMTLCRSGAKLVTSNIISFDANNYAGRYIGGIPVMIIVLQPEILDGNQNSVFTLN